MDNDLELDNLMFCEGITKCIIHNYLECGEYVCTQCGEEIVLNDPNADIHAITMQILYHVQGHIYTDPHVDINYDDDIDITDNTQNQHQEQNQEQQNEEDYSEEINSEGVYSDESEDDSASVEEDNTDNAFRCPVCRRGYHSPQSLGNHFMRRHNIYTDLETTSSKQNIEFPGYFVLNQIGMFRYIIPHKPKSKFSCNIGSDTCILCCMEYTDYKKCNTDDNLNRVLDCPNKRYEHFTDDMKLFYISSRLDVENINIDRHPIKLMCCGAMMCSECLRQHIISRSGEPCCPFCRKIHDITFTSYDIPPRRINSNPYAYIVSKRKSIIDPNLIWDQECDIDLNSDSDSDIDADRPRFYQSSNCDMYWAINELMGGEMSDDESYMNIHHPGFDDDDNNFNTWDFISLYRNIMNTTKIGSHRIESINDSSDEDNRIDEMIKNYADLDEISVTTTADLPTISIDLPNDRMQQLDEFDPIWSKIFDELQHAKL